MSECKYLVDFIYYKISVFLIKLFLTHFQDYTKFNLTKYNVLCTFAKVIYKTMKVSSLITAQFAPTGAANRRSQQAQPTGAANRHGAYY
jgi:hypothetical protein